MRNGTSSSKMTAQEKTVGSIALLVTGVAVNAIGSQVAGLSSIPFYLDCIGTMVASILGGALPGILVGYATNIVNTRFDPNTLYYGVVSVAVASIVALAANRRWLRHPAGVAGTIVLVGAVAGTMSSIVTYMLFGFAGDVSGTLATHLADRLGGASWGVQCLSDAIVDIGDKAVVLIISLGIAHLVPSEVQELLDFKFWRQKPLSREETQALDRRGTEGVSLSSKLMWGLSIIMVLVGVVVTGISYSMFSQTLIAEQKEKSLSVADIAASVVNPDLVDTYLEEGESSEGYAHTERMLAKVRDSFENVQYIYVYKILEDGCHVVIDPDTETEAGSDLGEVLAFDADFLDLVPELLKGHEIEPRVATGKYGWLLTAYKPLYDSNGTCAAYVGVDISMDQVRLDGYAFLVRIVSLFLAFFIMIREVVLWLIRYHVLYPLKSMASSIARCSFDDEKSRELAVDEVARLEIDTNDEIENLFQSMEQMVRDMVGYVESSQEQAATIARMQDNLILVMADLVESRDHFTGEHVRKTAAYTGVIMRQMRREGIYADQLTDEFIFNVEHSAPLHDIGKIQVSDNILNKPGRLTPEEFEQMKMHTVAGERILEGAVGAMSEPSYLDEARRLAGYHHEWWDGCGRGYPYGVAGEDIPLSARIMAVADVFDALVSKRSYKEGMPLDKAFSIIEEESGTHFDPQVAQAFLHARDEVIAIANEHGDANGTQLHDVHED